MKNKAIRSLLFLPANKLERLEKALSSGAHATIVDLEDSVLPEEKIASRELAGEILSDYKSDQYNIFLRINSSESEWFQQDVSFSKHPAIKGVVIPKASDAEVVNYVSSVVKSKKRVYPLIEDAGGLHLAKKIASLNNVGNLMFGSIDFQVDLGVEDDEDLLYYRSKLVLASRLANIGAPIDGVTTNLESPDVLEHDTLRAKKLGFSGKLCIHPRQVEFVNQCFSPSSAEIDWARRVIGCGNSSGVAVLDGKMVDRPVLLKAKKILGLN